MFASKIIIMFVALNLFQRKSYKKDNLKKNSKKINFERTLFDRLTMGGG
jgi:hypothetical protein